MSNFEGNCGASPLSQGNEFLEHLLGPHYKALDLEMPLFQVGEKAFVLLPDFPGLVQIDIALQTNLLMFAGEALEGVEFVKKELQVDVGINDFLAGFGLQGPQQVYGVVINPEIMLRRADNPGKDQLFGLVQALQFPSHQGFVGRPQCAEFDFQSLKKVEEGVTTLEEVLKVVHQKEELTSICPSCGREVSLDFKDCPYCKRNLVPACSSCGRIAQPDWVVCPYCRRDLLA